MTRIQFTPREQAMAPLYAEFYKYTTAFEYYPHYHWQIDCQVVAWSKFRIEVRMVFWQVEYRCNACGEVVLVTDSPQRAAAWAWQQLKEQAEGYREKDRLYHRRRVGRSISTTVNVRQSR